MTTSIARYSPRPWWLRLLSAVGVARIRQLPDPGSHSAGSDFAANHPVGPGYRVENSTSAYAAFPWVYAAVEILTQEIANRPVHVVRGRGAKAEVLDDHPMLDLLDQPTERVSGRLFRRQRAFDRVMTGNAFSLLMGGRTNASMLRLHPRRVTIEPGPDGQPAGYRYGEGHGLGQRYDWRAVVHVRGASWEDGPEGLWGQGVIRALHDYLTADKAAWERTAEANRRGRPDYVASPDASDPAMQVWGKREIGDIREAFERVFAQAHGGVAVAPRGVQLDKLSWSLTDLGSLETSDRVRDAVIAVTGVPGTKLGLVSANYATADEQSRTYWQSRVMPLCGEMDEADTIAGRRLGILARNERVVRAFDDVAELSEDRTARVQRVQQWWMMGLDLADAANYEGFDDLPIAPGQAPPADEPEEPPDDRALLRWLSGQGDQPPPRAWTPPEREEERADEWRGYIRSLHQPTERALLRDVSRYLEASRGRYIRRVGQVLGGERSVQKRIDETDLRKILDSLAEDEQLRGEVTDDLRDAVMRAFERAGRQMGVGFDPDRSPRDAAEALIGTMVARVNDTTRDVVQSVILDGLSDGKSVNAIQADLRRARAFSRDRALTIARTETTRATNAGSVRAYGEAANQGVDVQIEWLSARDGAVRHSHAELDGDRISPGGTFTAPSGAHARYPGDFADASESVNCYLPGTEVRGSFVAGVRSAYAGPALEIQTRGGARLRVTPNHPVMTPRGLVPAHALREGDEVLRYGAGVAAVGAVDPHDAPSRIEEVFGAIAEVGETVATVLRPEDLHGDARFVHRDVEVSLADGILLDDGDAAVAEGVGDLLLPRANAGQALHVSPGPLDLRVEAVGGAAPRFPGVSQLPLDGVPAALADGPPLHSLGLGLASNAHALALKVQPDARAGQSGAPADRQLGLASLVRLDDTSKAIGGATLAPENRSGLGDAADVDATLSQVPRDGFALHPDAPADGLCGLPALVSTDKISHIVAFEYVGHVYDLQSVSGLMVAQGIVCSNCRCTTVPVVGALSEDT